MLFLRLLLLTVWQTGNSELCIGRGGGVADYDVVTPRREETKSHRIVHIFK
jgi:hypothetical protein